MIKYFSLHLIAVIVQIKISNQRQGLYNAAIGKSEAMQIQQEIKDNGNWNKLKTPLTLLIIALLVFLFASEKETYNSFLKYLAIIPAGVAAISQVVSLLKPNNSSKN